MVALSCVGDGVMWSVVLYVSGAADSREINTSNTTSTIKTLLIRSDYKNRIVAISKSVKKTIFRFAQIKSSKIMCAQTERNKKRILMYKK